jgi:hypothetical protein
MQWDCRLVHDKSLLEFLVRVVVHFSLANKAAALQSLFPKLGLSKKALLLGAGFVTKPTVQILSDAGIHVTVGMLQ